MTLRWIGGEACNLDQLSRIVPIYGLQGLETAWVYFSDGHYVAVTRPEEIEALVDLVNRKAKGLAGSSVPANWPHRPGRRTPTVSHDEAGDLPD